MKRTIKQITIVFLLILAMYYVLYFKIAIVHGQSMNPTLHDSSVCLIFKSQNIYDGDIVVLNTKNDDRIKAPYIIKRYVEEKSTENEIYVLGDNPEHSSDSRQYGTFSINDVIGKVIIIF